MPAEKRLRRARAQDIDGHVGARLRERRIMTQQQMAELIGVTYQQAHKYEKGLNRVAAGRLYRIAQALGVEVGYFFEGVESESRFVPSTQQRMLLDLTRNYVNIPIRKHQEAIVALARVLAERANGDVPAPRDPGHKPLQGKQLTRIGPGKRTCAPDPCCQTPQRALDPNVESRSIGTRGS